MNNSSGAMKKTRWFEYYQASRGLAIMESACLLSRDGTKSHPFRVVLAGEFSSGKSTLVNCLLGENVAETHGNPTQACLTYYKYFRRPTVTIFRDGSQVVQTIELRGEKLLDRWFFGKSIDKEIPAAHLLAGATVEVSLPNRRLANGFEIIDTPGTGSEVAYHANLARVARAQADVMLYLCLSDHVMSDGDLRVIDEWVGTGKHFACVVTRVGHIVDSPARLREIRRHYSEVINGRYHDVSATLFWGPEPLDSPSGRRPDPHQRVELIWSQIDQWRRGTNA